MTDHTASLPEPDQSGPRIDVLLDAKVSWFADGHLLTTLTLRSEGEDPAAALRALAFAAEAVVRQAQQGDTDA